MGFIRNNLDFVASLLLTAIFICPLYYTNLLENTLIFDKRLFLPIYVAIIIGVFTIFALLSTFINVIGHFKKKRKISILNKSFKYPIIIATLGIIIIFISTIISWKLLILFNIFLFFYSCLSVVALFLTIYEIINIISTK